MGSHAAPAFYDYVDQHGSRGQVVPEIVMDHLEVPLVLPGCGIHCHDRVPEEIGSGPIAAVVIGRRRAEGHVDDSACLICGHIPSQMLVPELD
jgi:hypothetical protein